MNNENKGKWMINDRGKMSMNNELLRSNNSTKDVWLSTSGS